MISLEMAKKLKEAGLEWEPQEGDAYHDSASDTIYYSQYPPLESANYIRFTWLARLDQLLAEIEKLGWKYTLTCRNMNGVNEDYLCWVVKWAIPMAKRGLYGVTPIDAAASALLWILEGGTSK